MSKTFRTFLLVLAAFVQILQFFTNTDGQHIEATVLLDAAKPNIVRIEGKFLWEKEIGRGRNFSFLFDYAGIPNLSERVSSVSLEAADGSPVKFRRLIAGEYLADSDFIGWSYNLDLTPLKDQTAAGHVSWLTHDDGILFLSDLLPQTRGKSSASVLLKPTQTGSADPRVHGGNTFDYKNRNYAVIIVGSKFRVTNVFSGKTNLSLSISGNWKFTDEAASTMTSDIFKCYEQLFGSSPSASVKITIQRFPVPVAVGNYEADTRGSNITIISSDMPFESQSAQRLHEQLRHEMFHLWIPNGVNLSGNYDWFYEGFALYQSLKTGVAVNRIRFDDFLDTLSRAYDIDAMQSQKLSLIDASKNRWNGSNTQVYARGMLVAFMCDLALLDKSKGKRSVADVLREIYEHHRPPNIVEDGNTAVLAALRSHSELIPVIDRNITGSESIDWAPQLKSAGIEAEIKDQVTTLKVMAKPSGRQKDLWDKLGYNNWRKLTSK
ncbi:MAG: hypothetical protein ABIP78_07230 [Pyrinomonadaceae bacterium]